MILSRIKMVLSGKGISLYLALIAILLTLPGLWVGFALDDYAFLSILKGSPGLEGLEQPIWNTFSFSEGEPERNRIRMERGILPWWTVEGWKVDLWRPLASLWHWADLQIFGVAAWPMHLESLLLYGLLGALAWVLYARLLATAWVAGLAGLIFVADGAHGLPVGWLSNRNALLSGLFGVLALLAHDAWRRNAARGQVWGPWFPHGALALFWLVLALLSGETAVALGGFFFAYSLFLDPVMRAEPEGATPAAPLGKRAVQSVAVLLPYLVVVVVWRLVYTGLGHGVRGSWMYVDPLTDPGILLRNAAEHFPVLMLGLLAAPDSTAWVMLPASWQLVNVLSGAAFTLVAAWALWPLLRRSAVARFLALGTVLAVIPSTATLPMDRNLMFPSIGSAGLIALFVAGFVDGDAWTRGRRLWRGGARTLMWLWVVFHLVLSPLWLLGSSYCIVALDRAFAQANNRVPIDAASPDQRFVVINAPLDFLGASLPVVRSGLEQEVPRNWWWLSSGGDRPVEVERVDERTLVLRPDGGFLRRPWSQIFRRPETHPMHEGQQVKLSGFEATVTRISEDGRPLEVRFRFDAPLEDASFRWLTWSRGTYVPFQPPAVGERVQVPGLDKLHVLLLAFGLRDDAGV